MPRNWIAVASAEHVAHSRQHGFMQVCHGKAAPLRRLRPGERVIYYSPERAFRSGDGLQAFTACGVVGECPPYQVNMAEGFAPWRRDVTWDDTDEAPIPPILDRLHFTQGKRNWGYLFRFGLFEIDLEDADRIATAMNARTKGIAARAVPLCDATKETVGAIDDE